MPTIVMPVASASAIVSASKVCTSGSSYNYIDRLQHTGKRFRELNWQIVEYVPVDGSEPFCFIASPVIIPPEEMDSVSTTRTRIEKQEWFADRGTGSGDFPPGYYPPKKGDLIKSSDGQEFVLTGEGDEDSVFEFVTSLKKRMRLKTVRKKK